MKVITFNVLSLIVYQCARGCENGLRDRQVCSQQTTTPRFDHRHRHHHQEWVDLSQTEIIAALCELFDKTDTGGDGTISMKEYVAMCDEYGIELTDEHYNLVKSIANENGEVVPCPH